MGTVRDLNGVLGGIGELRHVRADARPDLRRQSRSLGRSNALLRGAIDEIKSTRAELIFSQVAHPRDDVEVDVRPAFLFSE